MTIAQRYIVAATLVVGLCITAFPEWQFRNQLLGDVLISFGRAPLWERPNMLAAVDTSRLALEWLLVLVGGCVAYLLVGRRNLRRTAAA